eukprot:1844761-Pleurochrysis_carterae.AAC.2
MPFEMRFEMRSFASGVSKKHWRFDVQSLPDNHWISVCEPARDARGRTFLCTLCRFRALRCAIRHRAWEGVDHRACLRLRG